MTIITLTEPIVVKGKSITELNIRRAKGKDYKRLVKMNYDSTYGVILEFAAVLSDLPPGSVDELCSDDVKQICRIIGPLLID